MPFLSRDSICEILNNDDTYRFMSSLLSYCFPLFNVNISNKAITHHFYFAKIYSSVMLDIAVTVWYVSLWSFVDEHNPLSYFIDSDVHYRRWTTRKWIMMVQQIFRIM